MVVGHQNFIVRADGKIYAWGCYQTVNEEKLVFEPKELTYFSGQKVISLGSGLGYTVALVEHEGGKRQFFSGKFVPLWNENTYKTLDWSERMPIESFMVKRETLIVQTTGSQKQGAPLVKEHGDAGFKPAAIKCRVSPDYQY